MKKDDFLEAFNDIDDCFLAEVLDEKNPGRYKRWTALTAFMLIVITGIILAEFGAEIGPDKKSDILVIKDISQNDSTDSSFTSKDVGDGRVIENEKIKEYADDIKRLLNEDHFFVISSEPDVKGKMILIKTAEEETEELKKVLSKYLKKINDRFFYRAGGETIEVKIIFGANK